ncbi:hypothetical protein QYM36_009836 [Artemia franciscana]|uniref:U3 small nucleolar RNA-associated protein 20 C-terminal domain-containing protein n=2 Tax=Artemia franciscana TaxID=6661 RepID=A0AA88HTS2_ARTSF|nr:hypothetical protein QYM36_009836 [Artemia franciscana]
MNARVPVVLGASLMGNAPPISRSALSITVIIRDVSSMKLEEDQLRVLLTYAEQSMSDLDSNAQTTGFAVLKAVLGRKLDFPELPDIMNRVSTLAVTSEMVHVRSQCRQLVLQYLADYPLGKVVIRKIQFFLGQLEYTREEGRMSALEFLCSVFSTFPRSLINTNAPLFFLALSALLVNETSKNCTQLVVSALKKLLTVLDDNVKNELFQISILWLQNETVSHQLIAIQLSSIFIEADGPSFESRLKDFLPILEILLNDESNGDIEKDQLLIQSLVTATKLFTVNPTLVTSSATVQVWQSIQKHLLHSQVRVRLLSARLIGLLFAAFTPEGIVEYISCKKSSKKMTVFDPPVDRLRALALDCSEQLIPPDVDSDIAEQTIKNLLFLFKVAARLGKHSSQVDEETSEKRIFGVRWYIKRIRKEINSEVVENPEATVKRIAAFHFYAAALLDLHQIHGYKAVLEYLPTVLPCILREINSSEDKSSHELSELATLAKESGEFMKQLVGHEAYTEILVSCRKVLQKKKMTRKVEKSQLAVTNPKIAARMRVKKQANKKEAKKKKNALIRGKVMKRKKLKDVALLEE